jgi:hypothetical protein
MVFEEKVEVDADGDVKMSDALCPRIIDKIHIGVCPILPCSLSVHLSKITEVGLSVGL